MLNQGGCIGHADVQPEPCACHLSTQEPSSFYTGAEVLEFGVTLKRWKTSGSFFVDADAGLSEFIETWCTHGGSPAVEVAFLAGANPYGFSVLLERELGKALAFADLDFGKWIMGLLSCLEEENRLCWWNSRRGWSLVAVVRHANKGVVDRARDGC